MNNDIFYIFIIIQLKVGNHNKNNLSNQYRIFLGFKIIIKIL